MRKKVKKFAIATDLLFYMLPALYLTSSISYAAWYEWWI